MFIANQHRQHHQHQRQRSESPFSSLTGPVDVPDADLSNHQGRESASRALVAAAERGDEGAMSNLFQSRLIENILPRSIRDAVHAAIRNSHDHMIPGLLPYLSGEEIADVINVWIQREADISPQRLAVLVEQADLSEIEDLEGFIAVALTTPALVEALLKHTAANGPGRLIRMFLVRSVDFPVVLEYLLQQPYVDLRDDVDERTPSPFSLIHTRKTLDLVMQYDALPRTRTQWNVLLKSFLESCDDPAQVMRVLELFQSAGNSVPRDAVGAAIQFQPTEMVDLILYLYQQSPRHKFLNKHDLYFLMDQAFSFLRYDNATYLSSRFDLSLLDERPFDFLLSRCLVSVRQADQNDPVVYEIDKKVWKMFKLFFRICPRSDKYLTEALEWVEHGRNPYLYEKLDALREKMS